MTSTDITEVPSTATQPQETEESTARRSWRVRLAFVTAECHLPQVEALRGPVVQEVVAVARVAASFLPPPRRLAYYGGLALLTVFEIIEWPLAAVIGVGAAVASRGQHDRTLESITGPGTETPVETSGSARVDEPRRPAVAPATT